MITVQDCGRCGHQDYNHARTVCSAGWCRKHCSATRATYGEPRDADTFDQYGHRQPATMRISIRP